MENLEMFRHGAPAEAEEIEQDTYPGTHDDMIPLSILRLDLDPNEPWPLFLGRRGIAFRPDAIGRDAISAGDAQRLIAERRSDELRQRERLRVAEQELVADDERRRALIWRGVAADRMPAGVAPAAVMLQNDRDLQPKRRTVLEEALSNDGSLTYHAWSTEDDVA
jgi:hypothetical protein